MSAFFGVILKPSLRAASTAFGAAALNRGWHTNVWPIIDGTPGWKFLWGTTLIRNGEDAGDQ
jgi:methionyl-tRNA formyltransferase